MNNKRQLSLLLMTALMTIGLLGLATVWSTVQPVDAGLDTLRVDKIAHGKIKLDWAACGEYYENLVHVPSTEADVLNDLGSINMSLLIEENGSGVKAYVELANTLVFTQQHSVDLTIGDVTTQEAVGPFATGIIGSVTDPNQLVIQSLRYNHTTQSGQQVQRQFFMLGSVNDGVFTGEYRETVWGYGVEPTTIVGSFALTVEETPAMVPTAVQGVGFSAESPATIAIIIGAMAIMLTSATVVVKQRKQLDRFKS